MRLAEHPAALCRRLAVPAAIGVLIFGGCALGGPVDSEKRPEDTPVVHVSQGDLIGARKVTDVGTKFMAFPGIPYAKPPTGELRFKAPEPAEKWDGVFRARTEGNLCPQPTKLMKVDESATQRMRAMMTKLGALPNVGRYAAKHMLRMEEDCLFLNVFTPVEVLPTDKLLPVLVFFHGGAFLMGSGDSVIYGPEYLMDKGILLVTLNYRLGPLGFLSTNTSDAPGNAGLKDQRLALRWIRDNIKAFGGDPAKVTIYGESAGSFSVHMHVLSPGSKGLFRSAIMSSSMATNIYGFQRNPAPASAWLAEALGLDADSVADPGKRVAFLRGVPFKPMFNKIVSNIYLKEQRAIFSSKSWAVVVEPEGTDDPFLTRSPIDILREGDFTRVPVMIGFNSQEGSLIVPLASDEELSRIADHPSMLVPDRMHDRLDEAGKQELAKQILNFYLKGQPLNRAAMPQLVELFGDLGLNHGVHVASKWHMKHATPEAPVFRYFLSLDVFGMLSYLIGATDGVKGAGHGDDLGYVFKASLLSGLTIPNRERFDKGRARMTEMISNFVKEGNPTPGGGSADVAVEWPPGTAGGEHYLDIGEDLAVKQGDPFKERMGFWDAAYRRVLREPIYDI